MLAYVTGSVDEELLARNEYLVTENRILRNQINGRIRLTDISLASAAKFVGLPTRTVESHGESSNNMVSPVKLPGLITPIRMDCRS